MATVEEIQAVLDMLGDDPASNGYDDARINELLDAGITDNAIAATYWEKRYASTAELIDISESGSSRGLSAVTKNAKDLAALYRGRADLEETPPPAARAGIKSHRMTRV